MVDLAVPLRFKSRVYPLICNTCRTGYNRLAGCGLHVACRRCGAISGHMNRRSERRAWRRAHDCPLRTEADGG